MISRIVLMKLNDKADASVLAEMQRYVSRISDELTETRGYHLAPNDAAEEGGYNWVLQGLFDDEADMNAYRAAPLHREFVGYCDAYTEDFLIAYYALPAG